MPRTAGSALRAHPWLIAFTTLSVAIAVLVMLWDWNWFKGPIERQVQASTGRELVIDGDLHVDLDWTTPRIRADKVRFANAAWSRQPVMASADRVEFGIRIWPLLRRQVHIPTLYLRRPVLLLETGPNHVGNWQFGPQDSAQAEFSQLAIDDGQLQFIDAANRTNIRADVASEHSHGNTNLSMVAVAGNGQWKGEPFRVSGAAESPLELRNQQRPYRIDAQAITGNTRAHIRGTLLDPVRLRDFDLQLSLSGQDMADLYPIIGVVTPPTPPYRLNGRLTREITGPQGRIWHYDRFNGVVGDSDIAGSAGVETGGARPYLRANLASSHLDFDDLAGFIGKAPQAGGGETTNVELAAQAARDSASSRLLPDRPYELEKLRAMDADVRYKAHHINASKWPLDDMETHLRLQNGLLQLEPLNFGVAGGDVHSTIRMNAREAPIRTRAQVQAIGLNLKQLLPNVQLTRGAFGRIGGKATLAGQGNSIAQMLGSSNGAVAIGMGRGQISNLVMELAGIDIEEALKFLVRGDRTIPIRCAFGDFAVNDGVMDAQSLAFDTTDTIIVGEGTIDMRDETLHLKLRPRPKDRSLLALRSPLYVDGTFKHPRFHPDYGRIGLRGAIALTLANIAPPAALLATLEVGPGEDAQCGGRYAK